MTDDLMTEAMERRDRAYEFDQDNQRDMRDDLLFKIGEQWPVGIKNQREFDGRPCLTINRAPQFINQVVNDIRLNSPQIKVVATDDEHTKMAEIYTGLIRSIQDRSDASVAYETAADGAVSCGIGHFRITTEFATDVSDDLIRAFDVDARISRIQDHVGVLWDPDSREHTREDAAFCFVPVDITVKEFQKKYPDAKLDPFDMEYNANSIGWTSGVDKIRLAEYWTRETKVVKTIAELDTGEVVELTKDIRKAIKEYGARIIKKRDVEEYVVKFHLLSGSEVLEGPIDFPSKFIPIIPVLGNEEYIDGKIVRSGLLRHFKDPQRMYNYWSTASTEAIALSPKAPWLVTSKQIAGLESEWDNANRQNLPYLVYNPDQEAPPPQRQPMGDVPVGMLQERASAADDMKAVTGIYDSSLGNSSQEKSGKAIIARERQSDVGTFQYADNLRRSLVHAGRVLVDMIPRIYDTERTVRILGEDSSEEFVALMQEDKDGNILDLSVGRYEVSVKTGPSFSTQREEARASMMEFVQAFPPAAQVAGDLVAKTMDWPGADELSERLQKIIPPGIIDDDEDREVGPDGQPVLTPEEQQQMQAAQQQQQMQQIAMAKMAAEAQEAQAKANKAEFEARTAEAELVLIAKREPQEDEKRVLENMETEADIALKQKKLSEPLDASRRG